MEAQVHGTWREVARHLRDEHGRRRRPRKTRRATRDRRCTTRNGCAHRRRWRGSAKWWRSERRGRAAGRSRAREQRAIRERGRANGDDRRLNQRGRGRRRERGMRQVETTRVPSARRDVDRRMVVRVLAVSWRVERHRPGILHDIVMRVGRVTVRQVIVRQPMRQRERGSREAPEQGEDEGEQAEGTGSAHAQMYTTGAGPVYHVMVWRAARPPCGLSLSALGAPPSTRWPHGHRSPR